MKALRTAFFLGGVALVAYLVARLGAKSVAAALSRLTWRELLLVCLPVGLSMLLTTFGWRYTFAGKPPPYTTMLAARIAGEAMNVVSFLGSIGGEAVKVWLLRPVVSYQESVPSVVIAKTAVAIGQALFLVLGLILAMDTGIAGSRVVLAMLALVTLEALAVSGFVAVQLTGVIGRIGRLLVRVGLIQHSADAEDLDASLRRFYRRQWPQFLLALAAHFAAWLTDVLEALVILFVLGVHVGVVMAVLIETLGSSVEFLTFFIPGRFGILEGANTAIFAVLGLGASQGLAFSLVRRARQAVWIGVGLLVLVATRAALDPVIRAPGAVRS